MMLDIVEPVLGKAFLDCGAFSVRTGAWEKLPIDDYIHFTNAYHSKFSLIAAPDVIGDADETLKNFNYFIERITFDTKKVISVYHLMSKDIKKFDVMLQRSLDAGLEWMAIGGAAATQITHLEQMVILDEIHKRIQKTGKNIKLHLFGMTDPTEIRLFKPASVDSSTFIMKAKSFAYHKYDLDKWKFNLERRNRKDWTREQLTADATEQVLRHSKVLTKLDENAGDYNYVYRQLERVPDSVRFLLNNILNVAEFENYARQELGYNFIHYITCSAGYVTGYSGLARIIFEYGWANRSLVAFPQFHDRPTNALEKDLRLFGENK